MDGPPFKRKRYVTACIECHRRKQKCNHGRPCSNCEARNVREKCIYDDEKEDASNRDESLRVSEESEQYAFNLTGQAGYSLNSDNNTYTALQKSLLGSPLAVSEPSRDTEIKDQFRQILAQLPTKPIIKGLIENYFDEANWYFLVLEQFYFNNLYKSWLDSRDKGINNVPLQLQHFPSLLFQVLAVSLQFLPLDSSCAKALGLVDLKAADQLSYKYSKAGVDLVQTLGRHHSSIVSVQHELMRSLWLKNCSRGTESWYSLGDSIKQAQDLGFHLQSNIQQSESMPLERTLDKLWYDEYKRRLWMTLFIWDSHMAFVLGRPRAINALDCTARTPLDCNIPEQPSKIIPTPANASDVPSTYSAHLFHYFLAQKIHEILSKGANKAHFTDYGFIQNLHNQVISYLQNLPPPVRPQNPDTSLDLQYPRLLKQRQHISNAAQSFLIALHRPHVNQHDTSRKAATEAAFACLKAQQQLFELVKEHQHRIYNLSFYTIDAAMFLSAMVIENRSMERSVVIKTYMVLCEAISRLSLMQRRSAMAKSGLQLLTNCSQRICQIHGIDLNSLPSASSSTSADVPHNFLPSNSDHAFQSYMNNALSHSTAAGPSFSQAAHNPTSLIANPNNYLDLSTGMGSGDFGASFDPTPNWNSYLDDLNNLDATETIGDSVWRDLLG